MIFLAEIYLINPHAYVMKYNVFEMTVFRSSKKECPARIHVKAENTSEGQYYIVVQMEDNHNHEVNGKPICHIEENVSMWYSLKLHYNIFWPRNIGHWMVVAHVVFEKRGENFPSEKAFETQFLRV